MLEHSDAPSEAAAPQSQITFFYYADLREPARFYSEIMGFELVDDQGFARIYRVAKAAFVGLVTGEQGFRRPQPYNAVLLTVLVSDPDAWYVYLKGKGVKFLTELLEKPAIQVRCFYVEDPGGYPIEIQQFLRPDLAVIFHAP